MEACMFVNLLPLVRIFLWAISIHYQNNVHDKKYF